MNDRASPALAALALAAICALAAARAGAQGALSPMKDSGWLIAGPFPAVGIDGLEDALDFDYLKSTGASSEGESAAAPLRVGTSGAKAWKETGNAEAAVVDFLAAFGGGEYAVAYAYRDIYSPGARRAALKLGSDDGVKVWINGELVLANHTQRAVSVDEDAVAVSLVKGKNRLLVKVGQGIGEWGFALRLVPLEEDAKAAASSKLDALAVFPDELAQAKGGTLRGTLMTRPAYCAPGEATVELLSSAGERLGSAKASVGGRFSIALPAGYSGTARLRARGSGPLARLASPEAPLFVGDARTLSSQAVARARRAASLAEPGDAATLEFLARVLEGKLPASLARLDVSFLALSEIEDLTAAPPRRPLGLARYAYRSPIDGSLQPYSLYLPSSYDPAKRYGLVVALHGASGNDYEMASSLAPAAPEDMIILAPYGRGDLGYASSGERDVMDAIDLVQARYTIDPDRVYLTGRSMGGYGSWRLGQLYPNRFAAIATFAGWTSLDCVDSLARTPMLVVHGDADPTIPIGPDAAAVERLRALKAEVRFDVLPGVGHDAMGAWLAKGGPSRLLDWFRPFKRARWPAETKVRTGRANRGAGAWASVLGISSPQALAALDARIVDSRHIAVDTQNVTAFELDLRHPSLAKGGRVLILADGFNLTADSGSASARFELGPSGRFLGVAKAADAAPANLGCGFAALFDGPLRVVYGTTKKSKAAENEAIAKAVAAWEASSPGIGTIGDFEVVPDSAVDQAMMASSSLLLVGWPDENSVFAKIAAKLPVKAKGAKFESNRDGIARDSTADGAPAGAGASGYGLVLCCPNPEAPFRLVGILALPLRGNAAVDFARQLVSPLATIGTGVGISGYALPDAMLLDKSGLPSWAGCFDWRWSKLRQLGSGRK
jgi:poly(3-hydroxybutyrate) depolymerase